MGRPSQAAEVEGWDNGLLPPAGTGTSDVQRWRMANQHHPAHHRSGINDLLSPPPRARFVAGWAMLPLRIFLGGTFLFAGLQKLANPNFFDANSPSSIQAQLIAANRDSPISFLVGHLIEKATFLGIIISLAELAIGIGMLLGLWTRIAAFGGVALSFGLFLTVSWHASPYYTGSDIVFLFAFLPFLIAGAGGAPAWDTRIAKKASEKEGFGDPTPYVLPFVAVQDLCGHFDKGRCSAQKNAACQPQGCPALEGAGRTTILEHKSPDAVDRRTVVIGAGAAAVAGVAGVALAGATAGLGRAIGGAPKATSSTTNLSSTTSTSKPASNGTSPTTSGLGTAVGAATQVPVGGAATFTTPSGEPGIVLQPTKGTFVAYNAVCPHAGCTCSFSKAADLIVCPCHGSEFKVSNGAVVVGPARTGLTEYRCSVGTDGQLYVKA